MMQNETTAVQYTMNDAFTLLPCFKKNATNDASAVAVEIANEMDSILMNDAEPR